MNTASVPTEQHAFAKRVLVVEDAETTRQRLTALLSGAGYQVDAAIDGLDALRKVSSSRYDAILLDLLLPNVTGWQFRETALRHAELRAIPTIVLTAAALRESDRYVLRTPYVLRKPLEDATVLDVLSRACRIHHSDPRQKTSTPVQQLFWSRRGEVACALHAPTADSPRWHEEQWSAVAGGGSRLTFQCQHCPGSAGPISRRRPQQQAGA
jgi:CheY-like chemotaxis protein